MTVVGVLEFDRWDAAAAWNRRRWLNQSTYSKHAISTCSTVRHGPPGLISSEFYTVLRAFKELDSSERSPAHARIAELLSMSHDFPSP